MAIEMMTEPERLHSYGHTCLNVGVVLCAAWIPTLGLIAGLSWATPRAAEVARWAAMAFAGAAPLLNGARVMMAAGDDGEVLREWAKKCLRPAWLFATGVMGVAGFFPEPTIPVVVALMLAVLPLGIYGVWLVRAAERTE